jgi:hypothetical protein
MVLWSPPPAFSPPTGFFSTSGIVEKSDGLRKLRSKPS